MLAVQKSGLMKYKQCFTRVQISACRCLGLFLTLGWGAVTINF